MATSGKPLYKQIIDWVLQKIRSGALVPGDKLPTEQELADSFQVSRGTARAALNMLCKNKVLEAVHGSGYYVSEAQDILDEEDRAFAVRQLRSTVEDLRCRGLQDSEIQYYFRLVLGERPGDRRIRIAVVECNPDILPVYHRQFGQIPGVDLAYCLVDSGEILDGAVDQADIVVTTPLHYGQALELRPDLAGKLLRYNISISRKTLLGISALPEGARLGLLCLSSRFADMVREALVNGGADAANLSVRLASAIPEGFLERLDVLILPAGSPIYDAADADSALLAFQKRGGMLLSFDYQIEKGSMAYIEEQVAAIAGSASDGQ